MEPPVAPPSTNDQLSGLWMQRAHNELTTSMAFTEVYRAVVALGAPQECVVNAARASADELQHALSCVEVASHYAGRECVLPVVEPPPAPFFSGCDERQTRLLTVVQHCCLSETIAVAYLAECRQQAIAEPARGAIVSFQRDEVRHSRIGWGLLSSDAVTAADRAWVGRYSPSLFASATSWVRQLDEYPEDLERGHGLLRGSDLVEVVRGAIERVVLPGFASCGVETTQGATWLAESSAFHLQA